MPNGKGPMLSCISCCAFRVCFWSNACESSDDAFVGLWVAYVREGRESVAMFVGFLLERVIMASGCTDKRHGASLSKADMMGRRQARLAANDPRG
jgi:hypothetical protein